MIPSERSSRRHMNSRRFAATLIAVSFLASTALAAPPQRRKAGTDEKKTPQSEMKAGGKPRVFVATSAGGNEG